MTEQREPFNLEDIAKSLVKDRTIENLRAKNEQLKNELQEAPTTIRTQLQEENSRLRRELTIISDESNSNKEWGKQLDRKLANACVELEMLKDSIKDGQDLDILQDLIDFHEAVGHPVGDEPNLIDDNRLKLRKDLIKEEVQELLTAMNEGSIINVAKESIDSIYVIVGTLVEYGIDFNAVWREVHRTNMNKTEGGRRADGKILKPDDWTPPEIEAAVYGSDGVLEKIDNEIEKLQDRRETITNYIVNGEY